jgi:hypothetical protein
VQSFSELFVYAVQNFNIALAEPHTYIIFHNIFGIKHDILISAKKLDILIPSIFLQNRSAAHQLVTCFPFSYNFFKWKFQYLMQDMETGKQHKVRRIE